MNGLGRYEEALAAATAASDDTPELFVSAWALSELIEAASRTGNTELAARALTRLREQTQAQRRRLGARHRGAGPRAAERGRGRRAACTARRSTAWGARRLRPGARPRAPALRRVAAPREPAARRARAAAAGPRGVRRDGRRRVRRARAARAAGHRREGAQARATRRATSSRPRRSTSRGSRATAGRTPRSARSSTSARAPSSGTCNKVFTKLGISSRRGLQDALPSRDREATPA